MRTLRIAPVALTALVVAALPPAVEGQGRTLAFTYQIAVDADAQPAFEAAWKEHLAFREANGETWTWSVLQQTFGDNPGNYAIRSGSHEWADLDSYFTGEFNAVVQAHLGATVRPLVQSFTANISMSNTALSHPAENLADMNVFPVQVFHLDGEGQQDFMEGLAEFKEAMVAGGHPGRWAVAQPFAGGPAPSVTIILHAANFAALENDEAAQNQMLVDHLGEERVQELFAGIQGAVESIESSIWTLRRDLSSGN